LEYYADEAVRVFLAAYAVRPGEIGEVGADALGARRG
jgi:hypothetical protein